MSVSVKSGLKQELVFSEEDARVLDGQSKICNWLYNCLSDEVEKGYKNNDGVNKLTNKYNLRNLVPKLKTVYSSVFKNTALRLAGAYKFYFERGDVGHPHHRSWKKNGSRLNMKQKQDGKLMKEM